MFDHVRMRFGQKLHLQLLQIFSVLLHNLGALLLAIESPR